MRGGSRYRFGRWIVAATLTLSACGVGDESRPTRLDSIALPPEAVPEEPSPVAEEGPSTVVFFVQGETLVAVERGVPPTLRDAIRSLLEGPRETEAAIGLRSAIPAGTSVLRMSSGVDTAVLDLSPSFSAVVGPEQVLALAQLVYTATAVPGIVGVEFAINGTRVDVATGDGSLASGAVGRADYPEMGPG